MYVVEMCSYSAFVSLFQPVLANESVLRSRLNISSAEDAFLYIYNRIFRKPYWQVYVSAVDTDVMSQNGKYQQSSIFNLKGTLRR